MLRIKDLAVFGRCSLQALLGPNDTELGLLTPLYRVQACIVGRVLLSQPRGIQARMTSEMKFVCDIIGSLWTAIKYY